MEINSIIKKVLFRYPIFGNVITNINFKFTTKPVPAPSFTDGRTIYYKQEFFTDFTEDEREFIISHEIFHIVLSHLFRNIGKDEDLLNYVEDAIINQLLIRDGLVMPDGLIYVEDALDYSVDELYLRYLPHLEEIKKLMNSKTYHMGLDIGLGQDTLYDGESGNLVDESSENESDELTGKGSNDSTNKLEEILDNSYNNYIDDLEKLMNDNEQIREELIDEFQEKLRQEAASKHYGKNSCGQEFPSIPVGTAAPLLNWQELLEQSLVIPEEVRTLFYEVEMDGIVKKEEKADIGYSESEVIIDSSGSMDMQKIKTILRECKNILSSSSIRVGFCDVQFYGWSEIRNAIDIDNLQIIGRGGTDFHKMADSFSNEVDNKIVITDGYGSFPTDKPDILWVIIGYHLPESFDSHNEYYDDDTCKINYIFINERDIPIPERVKSLVLKPNDKKS